MSALDESCRCFSLDEMQSATNNFDEALVIGSGGFGKVYKGFIDNGATTVAIKRLKVESNQGTKEFWTEVEILSKLRHTHLVDLIGHCNNCEEMILVYEYMANGTLADHLYKLSRKKSGISIVSHLTWEQRLDICIGVARGLDYLHTGTNRSFIHRDMKTTNILLDENWVAKISDFGLSKDTTSHSITHVTTNVKGTFGYLDPDYFRTHRLTKKSDVYAFGVVLFEVLCGRPAVVRELNEDPINLVFWAQRFIIEEKFDKIIDPSLSGQISPHCLKCFVKVANKCLYDLPKDRPTMAEVVRSLKLALESQIKRRAVGIITKVFQGIGMDHWWRERKDMNNTKNGPSKDSLPKSPSKSRVTQVHHRFSFAEIKATTNDFDDGLLIGQSLSQKVYKGYMDGGTLVVAVKMHKEETWQMPTMTFESEIEVQSLLNHPHIVSFIRSSNSYGPCVVFDYMVNGSLRDHLFGTDNDPLPWKKRLEICIGAARSLQHIHNVTNHRLAYDDINSSKIAKVIDFTWSWIEPTTNNLERDSLFYQWNTNKWDLRSFGYVLFEVLCAKEHCRVPSVSCIQKEIDPYLIGKIAPECLTKFVNIASTCFFNYNNQCPSMDFVVESLEDALELQKAWENSILE